MVDLTIYLYGIIPSLFLDISLSFSKTVNLEIVEQEIILRYGDRIPSQYKVNNRFNYQLVAVGDENGKPLNYESPVSTLKEIWFYVPLSGG